MKSAAEFRAIAAGHRRGVWAAACRAALGGISIPYTAAVRGRNAAYDHHLCTTHRVAAPVISVGNLTLGGTGKTPMVEWLARWFCRQGARVAIVSRGYGADQGAPNDEALELEQRLPGVPHLQNPDRVAAATSAIEELESQFVVLDDGFQHRRLGRDLDIVLLDALDPFGYGRMFPRGMLREPLTSLSRAHVVGLSRANLVGRDRHAAVFEQVRRYAPRAAWLLLSHSPRALRNADGAETPVESLAGREVAAFCGIGNPEGFYRTLITCGYRVAAQREFPDHHAYDPRDDDALSAWAAEAEVEAVVCTHKDLVKIRVNRLGGKPLWALSIGLEILEGQHDLEAKLHPLFARAQAD